MVQIITKSNRVNSDAIDNWQWETEHASAGILGLALMANSGNITLFRVHEPFAIPFSSLDQYQITSLAVEVTDYLIRSAEREDTYCHIREIFALTRETIGYLETSKSVEETSFEGIARKILGAAWDARITLPGINERLGRVEAYMILKSMRVTEPLDIVITTCFPKTIQSSITYLPHGKSSDV